MAKYKKWYYSSPETHLYYQKYKLHCSSALKSFRWVGAPEIIASALLLSLLFEFLFRFQEINFYEFLINFTDLTINFTDLTLTRLDHKTEQKWEQEPSLTIFLNNFIHTFTKAITVCALLLNLNFVIFHSFKVSN